MHRRIRSSSGPQIGSFLRSINVQLDAGEPGRIAHFRPTAKAASLLERLFLGNSAAVLVTAPYGSGKSLTATYALQIVENRDDCKLTLRSLAETVASVSPTVGQFAAKRVRSRSCGLCIAVQGHAANLRRALCEGFLSAAGRHGGLRALERQVRAHLETECSVPDTMLFLLECAKRADFDRVLLAWDEFGRHLESLITNGRPSELHDVQQLAEVASRARDGQFRMCVLLHQGFSAYAASAPDGVRREWKKIEERFERVEYVDDSKELIRLLVDLAESMRPQGTQVPSVKQLSAHAKSLQACGLLKEFGVGELALMLQRCYPLDASALHLLPRISARVAQNERTLFNFLQSADLSKPVECDALFRYFEPAMRQDVGVGGTYRAMLETNSAAAKCSSETEVRALHTACVLCMGLSGYRTKISRGLLRAVLGCPGTGTSDPESTIDGLIERKLLLYRRHSDEVSVWHGTDANLRERIAEQIAASAGSLELARFLAREWPLPAMRATAHNDRVRMRRYFERKYVCSGVDAAGVLASAGTGVTVGDGTVVHFLPAATEAGLASDVQTAIAATKASQHSLIVSVPTEPVALDASARELEAIMVLQRDRELTDADPLVAEELRQLEDDTRTHMLRLVERVTSPGSGTTYFCNGKLLEVSSLSDLRGVVSRCCNRLYPKTPILPNEQLNRRRPTPVVVNARKKLLSAVLEASGRPDLGFHEPKFQQELGATVVAQYRAIIRNTGLYRQSGADRWGFAAPSSLADAGLAAVWQEVRNFFTEPSDTPKPFSQLLAILGAPPFGVRQGVLPVLIGCGVRAFPVVGSMTMDGQYIADIRPSVIEDLCKEPERFALNVVAVEEDQRAYLEGVCELFRGRRAASIDDPDLVRRAFEWIQFWKAESPEATRVSSAVTERTARVRKALWSTEDPVRTLMQAVPEALGVTDGDLAKALKRLREAKTELDRIVNVYADKALVIMTAAIGASVKTEDCSAALTELERWATAIPAVALDEVAEPRAKGVVSQLCTAGTDPFRLANMISARLTKSVTRWDDSEVAKFQQEFRKVIDLVEEAAFRAAGRGAAIDAVSRDRLAALVESRIASQIETLRAIAGQADAARRLRKHLPGSSKSRDAGTQEGLFNGTT
jgi:hypothetical protein